MSGQSGQLQRLVDELVTATEEGRADWRAFSPGLTYRLERPSGTVILSRHLSQHSYVLEFLDSKGEKVLSHTEGATARSLFPNAVDSLEPGALNRLFTAVQDSLSRPRPEVESFLREL